MNLFSCPPKETSAPTNDGLIYSFKVLFGLIKADDDRVTSAGISQTDMRWGGDVSSSRAATAIAVNPPGIPAFVSFPRRPIHSHPDDGILVIQGILVCILSQIEREILIVQLPVYTFSCAWEEEEGCCDVVKFIITMLGQLKSNKLEWRAVVGSGK